MTKKKPRLFSVDDLLYAVEDEDFSLVKKIILAGINPDIENKYGDRALYEAAKICNDKILNFLLDRCTEVNFVNDEYNKTVLWYSVFNDNVEAVQKLIAKGADLDNAPLCGIYSGITPLHLALKLDNLDIAKMLIKAGADTNIVLKEFIDKGNIEIIKMIINSSKIDQTTQPLIFQKALDIIKLQKGNTQLVTKVQESDYQANSDTDSELDWEYAPEKAYAKEYYLHQAVEDWNLNSVEKIIHSDLVNEKDHIDRLPIHLMFRDFKQDNDDEYNTNYVAILKLLIAHGTNINTQDPNEELLPLEAAIIYGYTAGAKTLIKAGVECNKDDRSMFENAIKNGNSSLLKLALKHFNVNINSKIQISKKQEYTPLKLATQKGNLKIVKILLAQDELNITEQGISILSAAAGTGWLNKVKQIVESQIIDNDSIIDAIDYSTMRDFSFNVTEYLLSNYSGDKAMLKSPLYWSVTNDNARALSLLIKDSIEINFLYKSDRTLLHQAVLSQASVEIFQILIDSKINIQAIDNSNKTALHWLVISSNRINDHLLIAQLLIKHKINLEVLDYKKGYTALMYAAETKNLELVKLLIESGSNSELISKEQNNIFHISLLERYFANDRLSKYLGNNLDISILKGKNLKEQTILHVLTEYNSSIISGGEEQENNILILIKKGISIYSLDQNFTSPLLNIVKGLIAKYRYQVEEHGENLRSKLVAVLFKNNDFNIKYLKHLESILDEKNMASIINIVNQIKDVTTFEESSTYIIAINKLIEEIGYDSFNNDHIQRLLTHNFLNLIEEGESFENIYEISKHHPKLEMFSALNIKNDELQKLKEELEKLYVEKTLLSEIKAQIKYHNISVLELKKFIENTSSTMVYLNISSKVKDLYDNEINELYENLEELSIHEAGLMSQKNAISPAPWHHFIKMMLGSDHYSGNDDVPSLDQILRNNKITIKKFSDNNKYYWQISYLVEGEGLVYLPYKLSQIEAFTIDFYRKYPNYINPGQFLEEATEEINMKRKYIDFKEDGSINQEITMPLTIRGTNIVNEDLRRVINIKDLLPEQICENIQLNGDVDILTEANTI